MLQEQIKQIIKFMEDNNLEEIDIEEGDIKIYIKKAEKMTINNKEEKIAKEMKEEEEEYIKSEWVGIFSYNKDTLKVGNIVNKGTVVGKVNVLNTYHSVEAPYKAQILEIMVENNQPVEYAHKLIRIKRI